MTDDPVEKYLRTIHSNMVQRCTNPRHESYRFYGGAVPPVKIFDPWLDFETFKKNLLAEIGPRPSDHVRKNGLSIWELDRIDSFKGYQPGNIRWLHYLENQQNKRPAKPRRSFKRDGEIQLPGYHIDVSSGLITFGPRPMRTT